MINIAELLKDCPRGMELDCLVYEDVYFNYVDELNIIHCYIQHETHLTSITFNQHGTLNSDIKSKCVIFPKGKTTWKGFQRPFKDGDIVCYLDSISIFKEWGDATLFRTYVTAYLHGDSAIDVAIPLFGKSIKREARLATEEEKQKLFDVIKANGYRWNDKTKTLEKLPKFKVGDKVKYKNTNICRCIKRYDDILNYYVTSDDYIIKLEKQDEWELVPNKFDITTLVPFEDKVLVRNDESQRWLPAFWGYKVVDGFITTFGWCKYCIPYKGNEILFKTNNDCDDFYKTWE